MNLQKIKNVLFIEQGLSFGGAIVVIDTLISHLDTSSINSYMAVELDAKLLENRLKNKNNVYKIKKICNYKTWMHINEIVKSVIYPLRKPLIYIASLLCGILNTGYIAKIIYFILKHDISIVYVNNDFNTPAIIAAIVTRKPVIVHVHGVVEIGRIQKYLLKYVDHIIAISDFIKHDLLIKGIPESHISVVYNPVSIDTDVDVISVEKFKKRYQLEEKPSFAIVGRVVRWKGHKEFIEAAKRVVDKGLVCKALIVGDAADGEEEYYNELMGSIKGTKYEGCIIFTGFFSDVATVYAAVDLVVHTSIEPEPFGLVITEAMAFGKPVIASNMGATKELIETGVNGYLIHPESTTELADRIYTLLNDKRLTRVIGDNARKEIIEKYCPHEYAKQIGKIIGSI